MGVSDISQFDLLESKKVFFSEFDEEPAWQVIDSKIIIITIDNNNLNFCEENDINYDQNIYFDWNSQRVINIVLQENFYKNLTDLYLNFIKKESDIFSSNLKCKRAIIKGKRAHVDFGRVSFEMSDSTKSIYFDYDKIYYCCNSEVLINELEDNTFIEFIDILFDYVKNFYDENKYIIPNGEKYAYNNSEDYEVDYYDETNNYRNHIHMIVNPMKLIR